MSFLTNNAIRYTLKHLFKVAGITLTDNEIEVSMDKLSVKVEIDSKTIVFNISRETIIQEL